MIFYTCRNFSVVPIWCDLPPLPQSFYIFPFRLHGRWWADLRGSRRGVFVCAFTSPLTQCSVRAHTHSQSSEAGLIIWRWSIIIRLGALSAIKFSVHSTVFSKQPVVCKTGECARTITAPKRYNAVLWIQGPRELHTRV